jgi:hypothetical protein
MPKFNDVEVKTPSGAKATMQLEDNSDICWMYHKDMPKGKIVGVHLLDELAKDGWVDSPAKIKDEPVKEEKPKKK